MGAGPGQIRPGFAGWPSIRKAPAANQIKAEGSFARSSPSGHVRTGPKGSIGNKCVGTPIKLPV